MVFNIDLYYSSDIVTALENYYDNPFELLPIYQDIVVATGDAYIAKVIKNTCDENNLCPFCFSRLYIVPMLESRGECRGEKAYEEVFIKHCMNCGWDEC